MLRWLFGGNSDDETTIDQRLMAEANDWTPHAHNLDSELTENLHFDVDSETGDYEVYEGNNPDADWTMAIGYDDGNSANDALLSHLNGNWQG